MHTRSFHLYLLCFELKNCQQLLTLNLASYAPPSLALSLSSYLTLLLAPRRCHCTRACKCVSMSVRVCATASAPELLLKFDVLSALPRCVRLVKIFWFHLRISARRLCLHCIFSVFPPPFSLSLFLSVSLSLSLTFSLYLSLFLFTFIIPCWFWLIRIDFSSQNVKLFGCAC